MELEINPNMQISESFVGNEKLPILVIDNFLQNPELLVEHACQQHFEYNSPFYPGPRAIAPKSFQLALLNTLQQQPLHRLFELNGGKLSLTLCHYSLVTTPANKLKLLQRIPHFDSPEHNALAAVLYLFKQDFGGTSFYRHNKTTFEYINADRQLTYYQSLESENGSDNIPQQGYINGDTPLFTRIGEQKGVFNRLIVYRRNALHSGSIPADFNFSDEPLNGRLTISSFIDCL